MADFPSLPLWTDAYLADTRHLTLAEHGAYLLLLIEAWRRPRCTLPDNDELLARLTCQTIDAWQAMKPAVMSFWKLDMRSTEWTQKRLVAERKYLDGQRVLQSERATKGWKTRKNQYAGSMPDDCPIDATSGNALSTPTPTPIKKENKGPQSGNGLSSPDADFYRYGRSVLGNNSGGPLTRLKLHCGGDLEKATDLLMRAETKADPREYLMAIFKKPKPEKPYEGDFR